MSKFSKLALAAVFFFAAWMSSHEAKAQKNDTIRPQKEQFIDLSKMPANKIGGVYFYDRGKIIKKTDSVRVGTEITVFSYWTEKGSFLKSVFTDPVKYEPTSEDIKNRQYSFTINPKRTTIYKFKWFEKNGKVLEQQRIIKVVDENGKEIK